MIDKKEAMARLDAIEAEAKKLREIIEAPEKVELWRPKKPTLCWVWDGDTCTYSGNRNSETPRLVVRLREDGRYMTGVGAPWDHAKPLTRAEALTMVDAGAASRYPWDKAPEWANWAATDEDGEMYFYQSRPFLVDKGSRVWREEHEKCYCFGRDDRRCADFRGSLKQRPQEAK